MRKESGNSEFMSGWCLKQTCPGEGVSPAVPGRRQKEQIQRSWGRHILDTSKQWILTRVVLLHHPQRTSGKAWGCFLSSQCGTATVIYWVEPRDATKHSTMYRTTPSPAEQSTYQQPGGCNRNTPGKPVTQQCRWYKTDGRWSQGAGRGQGHVGPCRSW